MDISRQQYQEWKKERSTFRYVSNFYVMLYNIECLVTNISMVYYIQERYPQPGAEIAFDYSVVQTFYAVVQMVGGLLLGRYADESRNIRSILLANLAISALCNFIYTLPAPLWIVLMARAFMGVPESIKSAVLGKKKNFIIGGYN